MANTTNTIPERRAPARYFPWLANLRIPIATKLILGYLLVIVFISVVFMVVGVRLTSSLILLEAQEKVRNDLNSAREIYQNKLSHIDDVIRHTGERFFLKDALLSNNWNTAFDEVDRIREEENLDCLAITDKYGYVLIRTCNPGFTGDNQGHDAIINRVLYSKESVASTIIVSGEDLQKDTPDLAERANIELIDTPLARYRKETEVTDGMMLKAAAPIFDYQNNLIGVIYGGVLLNQNYEIVDKVKQTVYENVIYEGQDIGTATIFMDDIRISTNVKDKDGSRAIGTRVSEEVYNQVIIQGEPWIDRAYVVNNWYITAYEPITDLYGRIIGILYVGILEQKYLDIQRQTIFTFLGITVAGALLSMAAAYFIARRIHVPIQKLVSASKEVAGGNLDTKVTVQTNDELQYLAISFNKMSEALKKRDEQLKVYTTQRIIKSERLALVGQLAANVAHELNSPLQGIVTFSHLMIEDHQCENPSHIPALEKIVVQANRCRDIIRGLLDFSRQRKPDKALNNINMIFGDCISLVEHQALFHNIKIFKKFQESLPLAVFDASQVERVFINLIINAAEAMEGNGKLSLETRLDAKKEFVECIISDTGTGISEENLKKIFDPFFTTKDVGHGTGLGLAISYGVIKNHKGNISVESESGKGTTFIVRLPLKANGDNGQNG
ncbi:MAG: HAMP domain-containing protein [Anaerolineae bacterium]|jgi:two-component system NtrC family sensor kinase|nr:HAMP domain-containing protein [Anaerolineae bacterium]MBT4312307.1 HAMP domain-containing protein [Anaerolineae bacterium]MBT4457379.1 HAMP domain-containing protein [Anaerolineae bacterium]MBT4842921.1 HAMP domain-containing protein [Anaerolineae bacterium]MBT6061313.1 HAMP domain-containing protein [Anaerolineae bacterium]